MKFETGTTGVPITRAFRVMGWKSEISCFHTAMKHKMSRLRRTTSFERSKTGRCVCRTDEWCGDQRVRFGLHPRMAFEVRVRHQPQINCVGNPALPVAADASIADQPQKNRGQTGGHGPRSNCALPA